MKVITSTDNDQILAISNIANIVSNGVQTDLCVICVPIDENGVFIAPIPNIYDVSVIPENVEPRTFCYSPVDGFYENVSYIDTVTQEAIDAYTLQIIQEGRV